MKLVCPNCWYEFESNNHITTCPRCGAPVLSNTVGLSWERLDNITLNH